MASRYGSGGGHQGNIRDPGHDGRPKENREAGRTKGTTPGSHERAEEHGQDIAAYGHPGHLRGSKGGTGAQGGHEGRRSGSEGECGGDLKSRKYTNAQGNVHHHTRTYEEQHGGRGSEK